MLHWYCLEGTPNVIHKLIDFGFSVNVQNEFGNTPIMEAACIERWDVVRLLLKYGASTKLSNKDGHDFIGYLREHETHIPYDIHFRIWMGKVGI